MVPDNPSNSNPFIFRILDSLGIPHQNAPVNHTHSQDDVSGLESALNSKADAAATNQALASLNSGIAQRLPMLPGTAEGNIPKIKSNGYLEDSGYKPSDFLPVYPIDNEPGYGTGTHLISSRGVASALNKLHTYMKVLTVSSITPGTPLYDLDDTSITGLLSDGGDVLHCVIKKVSGNFDTVSLSDLFTSSGGSIIYANNIGTVTTGNWVALTIRKVERDIPTDPIVYYFTLDGEGSNE